MISVVDYDAGNLKSVETALKYLDADFIITRSAGELLSSDKVIFPGVGEASHAMSVLKKYSLDKALVDFASSGRPLLGICLGCQILLESSEEGNTELLGIIPGTVKRFPSDICSSSGLKIPQIGWNTVEHDNSELFDGIPQESSFYFVHSYYLPVSDYTVGKSSYGIDFSAAVRKGNVWGTQFHPEKSGEKGLKLLDNFLKL